MHVVCTRALLIHALPHMLITGEGQEPPKASELSRGRKHHFIASAGPQECPEWVTETPQYQHAVETGAIRPVMFAKAEENPFPEVTAKHVRALQANGYKGMKTIAQAVKFLAQLEQKETASFLSDVAAWDGKSKFSALQDDEEEEAEAADTKAANGKAQAAKP